MEITTEYTDTEITVFLRKEFERGCEIGRGEGYNNGYGDGYNIGYADGHNDGYESGYEEGHEDDLKQEVD
ncbi:MAG: hypothetical protein ACTSPB_06730 [Candidatus Thorarchaeota archaeon]